MKTRLASLHLGAGSWGRAAFIQPICQGDSGLEGGVGVKAAVKEPTEGLISPTRAFSEGSEEGADGAGVPRETTFRADLSSQGSLSVVLSIYITLLEHCLCQHPGGGGDPSASFNSSRA